MGKSKQKWTQEEEDALIAGIEKYGPGKWMEILLDPKFGPLLTSRSNVDIKDKWRNIIVRSSLRLPRLIAAAAAAAAAPARSSEVAVVRDQSQTDQDVKNPPGFRLPRLKAVATPASADSSEVAVSDPSQCDQDVKNPPGYNAMILEAVSTLKDANGSDLNAIFKFIEEKHNVPESFRREMTTRLRGLVNEGMLEKVRTCYKIKTEAILETKSPSPDQIDGRPERQSPVSSIMVSNDPMKEAADTAAYSVADAENKSYLAAEAVKEMETMSLLAEENELTKRLTMDYYRKCLFESVRHPL